MKTRLCRGHCPLLLLCLLVWAALSTGCQKQQAGSNPECIAPAKPGGGYDLTCRLLANGLQHADLIGQPMIVSYMPGGIGAVAYNQVNATRDRDPDLVVAASSGAAMNLALGKFGHYGVDTVRWLGAFATDYGVVVVPADSPYHDLSELVAALKHDPGSIVFGAGGSIGSQDWMKVALVAQAAGVAPKNLRFVSYEGGGEALGALLGHHLDVFTGDASEMAGHLGSGRVRVLAVLADHRLGREYADIPTAKEQGYDIEWPTWRGFYMGPNVSDADYERWVHKLKTLVASEQFKTRRRKQGLFPEARFGREFDRYVNHQVAEFRQLANDVGLGHEQ
ncbi:tripartite tricarboxylate transporter substrate binding protein [Salinisphaera sp. SPP-AMP-43]|uniref:Bug family tripartite tricarboxylate transporter substrate binding protein n=1 Tax=Salinisphaera sp. SPP-AMP-43 TaxID=3121288 RepID=UPI003C6E3466